MRLHQRWNAATSLHKWVGVLATIAALVVVVNAVFGVVFVTDQIRERVLMHNNFVMGPVMMVLVLWNMVLSHRGRVKKRSAESS